MSSIAVDTTRWARREILDNEVRTHFGAWFSHSSGWRPVRDSSDPEDEESDPRTPLSTTMSS
jgi:hypothetical protein